MDTISRDDATVDAIKPSIEEPLVQNRPLPGSYANGSSFPAFQGNSRVMNGFNELDARAHISFPVSREESVTSVSRPDLDRSEDTGGLITQVSKLLSMESPAGTPPPQGALDHEPSDTEAPLKHQLQVATLPTGICYDVRMRFHCEFMNVNSKEDHHPEEPRRIFAIYRELCEAGLVDDPMSTKPLVPQPLMRIQARDARPEEIGTVHDARHYEFVKSLASKFSSSNPRKC